MATKTVAQAITIDDEATMDAQSCIRGARGIIELVAAQIGDEDSDLAASPAHAEQCLWGVIRLLDAAQGHIAAIGKTPA